MQHNWETIVAKRKNKGKPTPKPLRSKSFNKQRHVVTNAFSTPPPHAYFISLELSNVRCFGRGKQVLDLTKDNRVSQWTVILGNNGVGKTTLLQCLAAFTPVRTPESELKFSPLGVTYDTGPLPQFRRIGEEEKWQLAARTVQANILPVTAIELFSEWTLDFNKQSRNLHLTARSSSPSLSRAPGQPYCVGYGAGRRIATKSLLERNNDPLPTLFSDEGYLRHPEEVLLQIDYAASKEGPQQAKLQITRDRLISILKNVLPDVAAVRIALPAGKTRPQLEFETPDGWLPFNALGTGYRTFAGWTVDLAMTLTSRYPDVANPLEMPMVALVDEIDLHMHPRWQREVICFLSKQFPNVQFVVTAHSPIFVHAASEAKVVVVHRDPQSGESRIDNDPIIVRNWRIDQLLTSDLFELDGLRPPQTEVLLKRRESILTKSELTDADQNELAEIEKEIGFLPSGTSTDSIEVEKLLYESLKALEEVRSND